MHYILFGLWTGLTWNHEGDHEAHSAAEEEAPEEVLHHVATILCDVGQSCQHQHCHCHYHYYDYLHDHHHHNDYHHHSDDNQHYDHHYHDHHRGWMSPSCSSGSAPTILTLSTLI